MLDIIPDKCYVNLFLAVCIFYSDGIAQENKDTSINLYFKINSFELDSLQYKNLKNFSTSFPGFKQIIGYADSTGTASYNFLLSKKRAINVYTALQIDVDSLDRDILLFKGESAAEPELWMNRRVQVTAHLIPSGAIIKKTMEISSDTVRAIDLDNLYFIPDQALLQKNRFLI